MRVVSPYCKQRKLGVGLETRLENCCVLLYGALMSPTHRSRMDRLGKTPPTSMPCCRRCCKTSTPVLRGGIYSACVTWYAAHVTCHMVCCTCHMVCCMSHGMLHMSHGLLHMSHGMLHMVCCKCHMVCCICHIYAACHMVCCTCHMVCCMCHRLW